MIKNIFDMDLKELKVLGKEIASAQRLLDKSLKDNKELQKMSKREIEINKKDNKLNGEISKLENEKYEGITDDNERPYSSYYDGRRESNISYIFKNAIKNAGFKLYMLRNKDIVEMAEKIAKLRVPKKVLKLEKQRDVISEEEDALWNASNEIENEIEKKIFKKFGDVKSYEVCERIEFLEKREKNPEKVEKAKEKMKQNSDFITSVDKIIKELDKELEDE